MADRIEEIIKGFNEAEAFTPRILFIVLEKSIAIAALQ